MIKIYKNGAWHPLAGQKIRVNGQWKTLMDTDRLYFGGRWHFLKPPQLFNWMTVGRVGGGSTGRVFLVLRASELFSMYIDWGDGVNEIVNIGPSETEILHTYTGYSTRQIRISERDAAKLTTLTCYGYSGEAAITALDVSNSTALEHLFANGRMAALDVSNNVALKRLAFSGLMATLDLSNNTALEYLDFGGPITMLDLSNNTALKRIISQNSKIATLDVSNNTALEYLLLQLIPLASNTANTILATLVSHGNNNGYCSLIGSPISAPPYGQGLIDKQTLINRGWQVSTD